MPDIALNCSVTSRTFRKIRIVTGPVDDGGGVVGRGRRGNVGGLGRGGVAPPPRYQAQRTAPR